MKKEPSLEDIQSFCQSSFEDYENPGELHFHMLALIYN